jgi:predicted HicB family RNase H-like nuclease
MCDKSSMRSTGYSRKLDVDTDHYTYRITWSAEDRQNVGLCAEFPSMSWLADTPERALKGIRKAVTDVVADLVASGEEIPVPLADRHYSGEFRVRIPPALHRALALEAAEQGIVWRVQSSPVDRVAQVRVRPCLGYQSAPGPLISKSSGAPVLISADGAR